MTEDRRAGYIGTHGLGNRVVDVGKQGVSPEDIDKSFKRLFGWVKTYIDENAAGYANYRRQTLGKAGDLRIISDVGFRELNSVGLKNLGNGAPVFKYVPPRPQAVRKRNQGAPIHVVMHALGGGHDKANLRANRGIKTIPVDPNTGFRPKRFFAGVRELTNPAIDKDVGIHHMVSRRGDLINSVSWDDYSNHAGGPLARDLGVSVNARSIGIELEEWYVRRDRNKINGIIDRAPYTEEQYAVVAFILKKFKTWIGTDDVLRWLGYSVDALERVANHEPGCFNHRASAVRNDMWSKVDEPGHTGPGSEWFFPQGYQKGDPLPSYLKFAAKWWNTWLERWYGDVPNGTLISGWDRVFSKVARIRNFDLQTEVFDDSLASGPIEVVPPHSTGFGAVAAAGLKGRDRLSSVQRANQAQRQSRSGLYSKAQTTTSASSTVWAEHSANVLEVADQTLNLPVIVNALGFDFETGKWVNKDTTIVPSKSAIKNLAKLAGQEEQPE